MASPHYKADEVKKLTEWVDLSQQNNLTIKAIALDVIKGKDACYWTIPSDPEKPLELRQVAWLEVTYSAPIKILGLEPEKRYKVNFMVSMKSEAEFGWSGCPVYLIARIGANKPIWKSEDLSLLAKSREEAAYKKLIPADTKPLIFTITEKDVDEDAKLSLGLYEIWKGRWKGGLLIHQINITRLD